MKSGGQSPSIPIYPYASVENESGLEMKKEKNKHVIATG